MTAFPYLYLGIAVVFEVIGTTALKTSDSLTRLGPSLLSLAAYAGAFVFLALTLRAIPVGIAYGVWAGLGIVLIASVGWLWFKEPLDLAAIIGLGLIVAGVVVVNVFSKSFMH